MPEPSREQPTRREQLLDIAAQLFATRGFRNTTVRDIADAAGILSGSLYHHFDSKESMVHEILSTFQTALFEEYVEVRDSDLDPRSKVERVVRISFEAIDQNHAAVAIYQNDAKYLATFDRFTYLTDRNREFRALWLDLIEEGIDRGVLRSDLDPELVFRFIRDTVWVAVNWYRPGGELSADQVADQYLAILIEGIARG